MTYLTIEYLIGKTLVSVEQVGDDEIHFSLGEFDDHFKMYHSQDCCESVRVEDIVGDLKDLVGSPILQAEEATNHDKSILPDPDYLPDSFTWTFYKLATIKGSVTIRWYGSSNGYYSESVDFVRM